MEKEKIKILVLGATGMAGHTIALYLHESGYDIVAFTRRKINLYPNITGDITDFKYIGKIIKHDNFDVVINAIGVLNKDAEINKSNAVLINSYLPHFLSDETRESETKIIQMSTDCVFSGKTGNYSENAFKDGETFYDRTKALGELDNKKDLTFRNSIIGPDMNKSGIGLFNWFMSQDGKVNGFSKAIWTGVTTLTLAKAMEQAIKQNLSGVYNLVNNDIISKYDLLRLFNKYMKNESIEIVEDDKLSVNKSLINNRTDFLFEVPSYEQMISEMKDWIHKHKELYPHYFK